MLLVVQTAIVALTPARAALQPSTVATRVASPTSTPLPPLVYSRLRGVTFYEYATSLSDPQFVTDLKASLPAIKRVGFNAVRLVSVWRDFEPVALPTPGYNESAFANLRHVLDLLRANGMYALLGLNYLGAGWAPRGIDSCAWITDPHQFQAFEEYMDVYLAHIVEYHDMVALLLFDEGGMPCHLSEWAQGPQTAAILRLTIGSLPAQLYPTLRSLFKIGFQDDAPITLDWAHGAAPTQSPMPYDFVSVETYDPELKDMDRIRDTYSDGCELSILETCTAQKLQKRLARFQRLYPTTPLILGEVGATNCGVGQQQQAPVLSALASYSARHTLGIVVWQWKPGPPDLDCDSRYAFGGAITDQNGALAPSALALASLWMRPAAAM